MEYRTEATYTDAKNGCYVTESNADGVGFDAQIPGEGTLFLSAAVILDAAALVRMGRARRAKADKAEVKARLAADAV